MKIFEYARMKIKEFEADCESIGDVTPVDVAYGYRMFVKLGDPGLGRQLIVNNKRETLASQYFMNDVAEGDVVIETGANLGYFTLMALQKPGVKVIAMEPLPDNVRILKMNLALNNVHDRVEVHQLAASDKEGMATFYVSKMCNSGGLFQKEKNVTGSIEVKTVKLDDFLPKKLPNSYLRMDTEGAELPIIRGMHERLKKHPPKKMFIEIHPKELALQGSSAKDFMDVLKTYGYVFKAAFYEGAAVISPKPNHEFYDEKEYRENPEFETRAAQVFFEVKK